jgi:hypothetical protein
MPTFGIPLSLSHFEPVPENRISRPGFLRDHHPSEKSNLQIHPPMCDLFGTWNYGIGQHTRGHFSMDPDHHDLNFRLGDDESRGWHCHFSPSLQVIQLPPPGWRNHRSNDPRESLRSKEWGHQSQPWGIELAGSFPQNLRLISHELGEFLKA